MTTEARSTRDREPSSGRRGRISLAARYFPITVWLPRYRLHLLRFDAIAGLTVVGLLVPEAMAYAQMAGAPAKAGLYAAMAGLSLYSLFGTCPQSIVAPTSVSAVTAAAAVGLLAGPDAARAVALLALLALLVGLLFVVAGAARLGAVAGFLSTPVVSGLVIGLALTVIARQLPKLSGIPSVQGGFFRQIWHALLGLGDANLATISVSAVALALIFGLRAGWPRLPGALIAVLAGVLLSRFLHLPQYGVAMTEGVPRSLPLPTLPHVRASDLLDLLPTAGAIAVVVYAEALAGGRSFGARHRYLIDPNQELIALGVSNLGAGLLGGMPVGGGLSASAANDTAGGRTSLAALIAAALLVATVLLAAPAFAYLPQAVLGAVVVRAVWSLIDLGELNRYRHLRTMDFGLALCALLAVLLFGVLVGLAAAVGLSLAALVVRASRPRTAVLGRVPGERTYTDVARHPENEQFPGLLIFRLDSQLFFANAGVAYDRLKALVAAAEPLPVMVIWDLEVTAELDVTAVDMLLRLLKELRIAGIDLAFARVRDSVRDTFGRVGLLHLLGEDHLFLTIDEGVQNYLRRAPLA